MKKTIRHVAIALSGGVDSAVAAHLLLKRGWQVTGVYMNNWDHVEEGMMDNCPRSRDMTDAQWVADRLSIPLRVVDFAQHYWNQVFQSMLDGYRNGRTIVGDVHCNRLIKFGALLDFVTRELGVDALATGHFARTSQGDYLEHLVDHSKAVRLLIAADPLKDQTYFLSTIDGESLRRVMFPIGSLYKWRVRQLARDNGLSLVADKAESMGICFIGKRKRFSNFIDQYIEPVRGHFVDVDDPNRILASHEGVHHFTLGKRVRLPPEVCQCSDGLFVAGMNAETQTISVVCLCVDDRFQWLIQCRGSHHPALFAYEWLMEEPRWLGDFSLSADQPEKVQLRCQRQHPLVSGTISRVEEARTGRPVLLVQSKRPLRAVAEGQTCVLYRDGECLGGGEVVRTITTLADN